MYTSLCKQEGQQNTAEDGVNGGLLTLPLKIKRRCILREPSTHWFVTDQGDMRYSGVIKVNKCSALFINLLMANKIKMYIIITCVINSPYIKLNK